MISINPVVIISMFIVHPEQGCMSMKYEQLMINALDSIYRLYIIAIDRLVSNHSLWTL